ncbi:glutamine synthetase family protein [Patulibacter brassicae]|uniref:Glutamine synthetase family protein n=1 Tax=Patulibacter brassicae TaxID=1705717 RepID=A0ABU4VFY6_9ACTN|nr:glutamine synthetase family protein [Patulibacter brassicae]MDX8150727.1 glutamine synthetase family protein [Patulibacter brassicae]
MSAPDAVRPVARAAAPSRAGRPGPAVPRGDLGALRRAVADGTVEEVVIALPDLQGRLQGSRIDADHALAEVLVPGGGFGACDYLLAVDVDMRTDGGYAIDADDRGFGDLVLRPDPDSLCLPPWWDRTALVIADAVDHAGAPVDVAPRSVLRRQLERLADHGLSARCGTELEFVVFDESPAAAHERGFRDLTPASRHNADYGLLATAGIEHLTRRIRRALGDCGLRLETARGECHPGQYEIVFRHEEALRACDDAALLKLAAKAIAGQEGRALTFMARVDEGEGSSCHVHMSLTDRDGRPAFAAEGEELPDLLRHALAGQLACLGDFALLWAPTTNSYKRLQPGTFAPDAAAWGWDNRLAALRIAGHGAGRRIEHRVAGADANPYLVVAGIAAAAVHGIEHGLEPGDPVAGPPGPDAPPLPRDLAEALARWRASPLVRAAFGPDVQRHLARAAAVELDLSRRAVTDWERRRLFERI